MNNGPHERGAAVAELPCRDVACYVSQHPHLKKSFAGHAGSAEGAQLCSPGREAWESVIDDSSPGGVEILVGLFSLTVAISLILAGYFALPTRYRLPADWQEGAGYAMFNFVFVAVWFFRDWGRRSGFWISLLISSTAHALMVHAWIVHVGADMLWRHRAYGKAALLLGLMLFFVVYGGGVFLRRRLYGLKATA
jgi:hypothetical protein